MSARRAGLGALVLLAALSPSAGALSLTTAATPSFSATLTGVAGVVGTYQLPLSATGLPTDLSGWNLTVTSTRFATGGAPPRLLPAPASSIVSVSAVCPTTCVANPSNTVTYPVAVPSGAGPPPAAKFFSTGALTGIGTFTVTPTIQVTIPATAYAGVYTSTLTLAIVAGP
jgi:hypothetical protein